MILPAGYTLRPATPADAGVLAFLRAAMLHGAGLETEDGWAEFWSAYFARTVPAEYAAFLVFHGSQPVACAALTFPALVPSPAYPAERRAHLQDVFVLPEHRLLGLAEALTRAALAHARSLGLGLVTLNASAMARDLYLRLGFRPPAEPELRLLLVGERP